MKKEVKALVWSAEGVALALLIGIVTYLIIRR